MVHLKKFCSPYLNFCQKWTVVNANSISMLGRNYAETIIVTKRRLRSFPRLLTISFIGSSSGSFDEAFFAPAQSVDRHRLNGSQSTRPYCRLNYCLTLQSYNGRRVLEDALFNSFLKRNILTFPPPLLTFYPSNL